MTETGKMISRGWSAKKVLATRLGCSSQGGFTLVLALVVLSVMFAASAGLSLARQFWGFSAAKHLDRVLMEASVAADMSLWFSVFRAQVQDSALTAAASPPNVDFGAAPTQQMAATSMNNKAMVWPAKAVSVVYPVTSANATTPLFTPPDPSKYPEFAAGVSTWHFDRLFRLDPMPTWLPGGKQDLKGTVPYPMGAKDPYFGSYSRIHGMPLLFRREMTEGVYKERVGRFAESDTKLRAWYSIDGAGNLGAGIRSLPISQFTLFSTQPYLTSGGVGAKDPLILSFYRQASEGQQVDPNMSVLYSTGVWAPAALFLDKNESYSYSYQDPDREGVAYPASRVGIGRVYVEGYARVRGGVLPGTTEEQPLPLGIPLVVTGDGTVGETGVRGYGGLFGANGSTLSGKPAAFTSYYDSAGGTTFSFSNFSEYLQFGGLQGGFMVSSSHVTPCRLIRTFADKDAGGIWRNKPLEGFVEEWGEIFGGVRDRLTVVGNGTSGAPFALSVTTSSNSTRISQAWSLDSVDRVLTFSPSPAYLSSGWGVNEPPLVVYLDKSWKTNDFKIVLNVPNVSGLGQLTNGGAVPREGTDRLTILSVQDIHLQGSFNGNGTDSGTMVVAPRIFVDPGVEKLSGIFVTEAASPMRAFATVGGGGVDNLFYLRGGLVLWNRTERQPPSWAAGQEYFEGSVVARSGTVYKANQRHVSAPNFGSDSAKWDPVVMKPVCLVPDVDYISGRKMPYGGWASVDSVPRWVGPPVVMDARAYTETLELYKIRAARNAGGTGYRGYKEENRKD